MRSIRSSLLGLAAMVGLTAAQAAVQTEAPAPKPKAQPKKVATSRGRPRVRWQPKGPNRNYVPRNYSLTPALQDEIFSAAVAKRARKQDRPQGHFGGAS